MKKILNLLLMISFIVTVMEPLTGIRIHKLASALFLLLCIVHTVVYRKKLGMKRWLLFAVIIFAFSTGLFGMIFEQYPVILTLHRLIAMIIIFFLGIHIFVFRKEFRNSADTDKKNSQ